MSLSAKVFVGLAAGVGLGLFIGERASALQIVADAYVKLLQMTVLPYVTLSLVGGLGSLSLAVAKRLGSRALLVLISLWAIALVVVLAFPLMFPRIQVASFFSTTLLDEGTPLDLVGLYIPENPFNSLANNIVPAVVLFSALLGIALIGIPDKAATLEAINVLNKAVSRVAQFIVGLTPYGLFAIAAVVAGTFDPAQAAQLQVYLLSYIAMAMLLTFWLLPGLVAALTPIPHRAVLARTRDSLVMAFTTGNLFVVLPLLAEQSRDLLKTYTSVTSGDEQLPDIIIPAAFNFPHTAKLLSLSFILFAAWLTGSAIPLERYPEFAGTGLLVAFGSLNLAIPFLLDRFRIPADAFQLFLATSVVNARFGTLLSAVHTIAIALIGTCAVTGMLRVDRRKLLRFAALTLVLFVGTIAVTKAFVARVATRPYEKDKVLTSMQSLRERGKATVFTTAPPPLPAVTGSVLDRVRDRKTLRVGYFDDSLPYVFINREGRLVGFDVEMALQLAHDLGVGLELAPVDRAVLASGLDPSACDLIMSGAAITSERAMNVLFSSPYLDETLAMIVPDHRRAAFASWEDIRAIRPLRLAVPDEPVFVRTVRTELPGAEIVPFTNVGSIFEPHDPPLDGIVLTAERGSAYTLLHPEFSVVVPKPRPLKVPLAYVIAGHDQPLVTTVNTWIDLKKKDGTIDELFEHWILGRNATPHKRRWSVLDDLILRR